MTKDKITEVFKRDLNEYTSSLEPIKNYYQQLYTFIAGYKGIPVPDAKKKAREIIDKAKKVNPEVTFRYRQNNGDRVIDKVKLTDYLKDAIASNEVIVPSFTTYDHPSNKKSLHAEFQASNIEKRKYHKDKSFAEYQNGNMLGYVRNDVLQKVMKIFNNSLSGAYASKSTILYNPSQHYTLTTITRSIASIGNAVSESVVAGNKNILSPEHMINYVTSIVATVNMAKVASAIKLYKLYVPNETEVMDMLLYSSRRYWENKESEDTVRNYLTKLSGTELAAIMYVNDLHHLRKYNDTFVKNMLTKLSARVVKGSSNPLRDLTNVPEGITNLVHHICMEDIQGMKINYKELVGTELLEILGSTSKNIMDTLNDHTLLFKALFTTDILPIDIANVKSMYRDVIVLSDTDSTCGSYDVWTEWYFGCNKFTPEAVALSAAVMTINTQVIDHNIRVFAKNMNIETELVSLLKMKNEYFWSVFITANVSKHYYANTWIQEGNVYDKAKLELKGVHFIASAGNQEIVSDIHDNIKKILTTIENDETIDPIELIKQTSDLERSILKELESGSINFFKLDKIKEKSAYKLDDCTKTPYFHHLLWSEVFKDKYGTAGDPTYVTVKIPTVLKSRRALNDYLENIEDPVIREKMTATVKKYGKVALGTLRVPLVIASGRGIPVEMIKAIDKHRMILDNLNILYIKLESLGIYRKPGLLFSEMGY